MSQQEVVLLSGVRTAIGDYGSALKDVPPTELAAMVVREAVARAGVEGADVGACVFGNVLHTEPKDMYLSRVAAVNGGLSESSQAFTLNRLCGSGLQAICSAAQQIMLGDTDAAVAGGAENMSRGLYGVPSARWGQRMGNATMIDMMVGALTDPFETVHMGITAENVAERWGVTREDQDALAVESHQRAAAAQAAGKFKDQILPVELKSRKGSTMFEVDEHVRGDASIEGMAKLRTAFKKDGTVTAGQRLRHQRRRRRGGADECLRRTVSRAQADGAAGGLFARRRRSEGHGHWSRAGHPAPDGAHRSQRWRYGRDRTQRGLCRAGPRLRP